MLDLKALLVKLTTKLPRVYQKRQTCTFISGKSYVDISYSLPSSANILLMSINGRPNADWIYADISAYSSNIARIAYNNTYNSSLTGDVVLNILYTL